MSNGQIDRLCIDWRRKNYIRYDYGELHNIFTGDSDV